MPKFEYAKVCRCNSICILYASTHHYTIYEKTLTFGKLYDQR